MIMNKKRNTIEEIADFLLENGGITEEGRVHYELKGARCEELESAIVMAELRGLPKGFKPYHARQIKCVWDNPEYVENVLVSKIDQVLEEKCKDSLFDLITKTVTSHLFSHFKDEVNGKALKVSMRSVSGKFNQCAFEMVKKYVDLKGIKGFENLKPYHFKQASQNTWDDECIVNEVLKRRIGELLKENYNNDFVKLISKVSYEELVAPIRDKLDGKDVEVSLVRFSKKFGDNIYNILKAYVGLEGLEGFENFKPYHLNNTTRNTWNDQSALDEVLMRKVDQLLEEKYEGSLARLIECTDKFELFTPIKDNLGGKDINISVYSVGQKFNDSPYLMIKSYIDLKGLKGFDNFKAYHLGAPDHDIWSNQDAVNEVLVMKIDQLLEESYKGDLIELIKNTCNNELLAPVIDKLNGEEVKIRMRSVADKFNTCPFKMIKAYICLKGLDGFEKFKPYHLGNSSKETWSDQDAVNEVLVMKIDQLLEEKYGGDLVKLTTSTNHKELTTPVKDELGGKDVEISMYRLNTKFNDSPYEMLKKYHEIKGLPFNYTKSNYKTAV